ncbi:MAG: hypothetical protein GC156_14235 [Actinomycetales bacterium]|nr:hypothetical protein [Actinomycetales bacterium]
MPTMPRLRIPRPLWLLVLLAAAWFAAAPVSEAAVDPAQQLADRYAPVVVVREQASACGPGEPYRPEPVESILGQPDVTLIGPAGERIPAPTAAQLAGKGDGWYLDLPANPLSPGCDYERWAATATADLTPTVYARVAADPDHPGQLALQYWFWWVYNDWNDKHEGDWEMIQLLFDASTAADALAKTPVSTAYAQHEGSETASWDDPKLVRIGDHPVVYPGQGSHAAYYTQSRWFGKSAAAGFGCDNTAAPGARVDPAVVLIPEKPSGPFGWLDFTGRWGQKAPSFNNGPTGPNTKTQWAHPVTWQLDEGRPAAVALPVVGGPAVDSFCNLAENASLLFIALLDQPILVVLVLLLATGLTVLLVRGTRWRTRGDTTPDRERRAGQVVTSSFVLLLRHLDRLWPILLVVALTTAGGLAVQQFALRRRPTGDPTDVFGLAAHPVWLVVALLVPLVVAPLVAWAMAATSAVMEGVAHKHRISGWSALALAVRHPAAAIVQMLLLGASAVLISSLWLLPLALLVIAVWSVTMPAAVIEDLGVRAAFGRSRRITRGRRWRSVALSTLLVWVGFTAPNLVGGLLLLITGWPFWVTNLVAILAGAVLIPFSAIGLTLQFYDFRHEWAEASDQNSRDSGSSTPRSAS